MSRVAYVNGAYVPNVSAVVSIHDRGYFFADAVYEVLYFKDKKLVDEQSRFDRLFKGLGEIRIDVPWSRKTLSLIMHTLMQKNLEKRGIIYLQISRGVQPRNHPFPSPAVPPALVMTLKAMPFFDPPQEVKVITVPDIRWKKCNLKTTNLLANVLVKQAAIEADAYEGWMVNEQGHITEGSSTNAYIVNKMGEVLTYPLGPNVLPGCLRRALVDLAPSLGITIKEKPFTVEEAYHAKEAFLSSTTQTVVPVVQINEQVIGSGKPGPITMKLREAYIKLHNLG